MSFAAAAAKAKAGGGGKRKDELDDVSDIDDTTPKAKVRAGHFRCCVVGRWLLSARAHRTRTVTGTPSMLCEHAVYDDFVVPQRGGGGGGGGGRRKSDASASGSGSRSGSGSGSDSGSGSGSGSGSEDDRKKTGPARGGGGGGAAPQGSDDDDHSSDDHDEPVSQTRDSLLGLSGARALSG